MTEEIKEKSQAQEVSKDALRGIIADAVGEKLKGMQEESSKAMEELKAAVASLNEIPGATNEVAKALQNMSKGSGITVRDREFKKGERLGMILRAAALHQGNKALVVDEFRKTSGYGAEHDVVKSMLAGTGSVGGIFIPQEFSTELIEELQNATVFRQAQPESLSLPSGNLTIPRDNGGVDAYWVGEKIQPAILDPDLGQLTMGVHKLMAMVDVTNDLLRLAPASTVTNYMINKARMRISQKEDVQLLRLAGGAHAPAGLRHQMHASNILTAAGVSVATIRDDLRFMIQAILLTNVPGLRMRWIMTTRTKLYLGMLRDAGLDVFPEVMRNNTLLGYPILETNAIPTNLGVGGNETEIYLADFSQVYLADGPAMEVSMSQDASYTDSGSNTVRGYAQDMTLLRLIHYVDMALVHPTAASVLTAVSWDA